MTRDWRAAVRGALRAAQGAVRRLAPGAGRRVVAGRAEGYRAWDPEVIRVDVAAERAVVGALRRAGVGGTLLSEEAGRRPLGPARRDGEAVYAVLDPFDGSMQYRQGIRAHWFTALGLYGEDGAPRAAGLVDHVTGEVTLADRESAIRIARPGSRARPLHPASTGSLDGACFEAYMMKPAFLYGTATALRPLFERARFILPNGGPAGFADVAAGRIDVYFAWREALTEVFSGLYIAERAGCVVTGWDGARVRFEPDVHAVYSVVCSANPRLHAKVLEALHGVPIPKGLPGGAN